MAVLWNTQAQGLQWKVPDRSPWLWDSELLPAVLHIDAVSALLRGLPLISVVMRTCLRVASCSLSMQRSAGSAQACRGQRSGATLTLPSHAASALCSQSKKPWIESTFSKRECVYVLPVSKDPHRYVCSAATLAGGYRGDAVIRGSWQAQTSSSVSL